MLTLLYALALNASLGSSCDDLLSNIEATDAWVECSQAESDAQYQPREYSRPVVYQNPGTFEALAATQARNAAYERDLELSLALQQQQRAAHLAVMQQITQRIKATAADNSVFVVGQNGARFRVFFDNSHLW